MNTHNGLTNALESDLRAIASQSRAAEMKRLWQALWNINSQTSRRAKQQPAEQQLAEQQTAEQHTVAPLSNSESAARRTPTGTEQLPKAA